MAKALLSLSLCPPNLQALGRTQPDRLLANQKKLWATLAARPVGQVREFKTAQHLQWVEAIDL